MRLFAAETAWMSPVKWRLISSIGRTWEYPPPAAPPFVPNTGPSEGSRIATIPFVPRRFRAWPSPTVVGLPLPVARRRDPRDEDELPLLPLARALDGLESDLRAVVSFQDEVVPGEPDVLRDVDSDKHRLRHRRLPASGSSTRPRLA